MSWDAMASNLIFRKSMLPEVLWAANDAVGHGAGLAGFRPQAGGDALLLCEKPAVFQKQPLFVTVTINPSPLQW